MADAQHLPQGRRQAGDRHLKFHETRDNLELAHAQHSICRLGELRENLVIGVRHAGVTDELPVEPVHK